VKDEIPNDLVPQEFSLIVKEFEELKNMNHQRKSDFEIMRNKFRKV